MKKILLSTLIFFVPLFGQVCDVTGDGMLNVGDIVELVYIILESPPPDAGFIADPTIVESPLEVAFTNTSYIGNGIDLLYEWDFDDGSPISNQENPIHIFTDFGAYSVCLTVTTSDGFDTACEVISIAGANTVVDIDGNSYQTITIGNQEWMAENLKVTHYRNGDAIPTGYSNNEWSNLDGTETGAYAVYDDDPANAATYGNLYNWYAVDDSRGVCPEGWHVPTDEEWMELEMTLGMSYEEAHAAGWRGTDEGSQLAGNADLWYDGDLENNGAFGSSGFLALPDGYRYSIDGLYSNMGNLGDFWSFTANGSSSAWGRTLGYSGSGVFRSYGDKRYGFSVRCLGD